MIRLEIPIQPAVCSGLRIENVPIHKGRQRGERDRKILKANKVISEDAHPHKQQRINLLPFTFKMSMPLSLFASCLYKLCCRSANFGLTWDSLQR